MIVLSVDLETYGAVEETMTGEVMPHQTVFHPARSIHVDGCSPDQLIQTAAVTLVEGVEELSVPGFAEARPGDTMTFKMHVREHVTWLRQWLARADVVVGTNLGFDLLYLLWDESFRWAFYERQPRLLDLMVLNYLHDETRPEKSLKSLGPVLRTHRYDTTLKHRRFRNAADPELLWYNAEDTHNTVLACSELCRRIVLDYGGTHEKCTPFTLDFYSRSQWAAIAMSRVGVCMDQNRLVELERRLLNQCEEACAEARTWDLPLEGTGSGKAKKVLMEEAALAAKPLVPGEDILGSLSKTPKKQEISVNDANRHFLLPRLEDGPHKELLQLVEKHAKAQKLISSYTFPLLRHRRNRPDQKGSVLVRSRPWQPSIAYPTWYVTPGPTKDGAGDAGGTIQGRITCKNPAIQTFPKAIKQCITSRYPGGVVLGFDLSQIELRVLALLSGEPTMVEAYAAGGVDFHKANAAMLLDKEIEDVTPAERQEVGKMISFWDAFVGSWKAAYQQLLSAGYEIEPERIQQFERSRFERRPRLARWQLDLAEEVERRGFLTVPVLGQTRYYVGFRIDRGLLRRENILRDKKQGVDGGGKYIHEIVNQPVQTTAGNVMLAIQHGLLARLDMPWAFRPRVQPILMTHQIYDSCYLDLPCPTLIGYVVELIEDAVRAVEEDGVWAALQELSGVRVPLEFDIEYPPGHEPE